MNRLAAPPAKAAGILLIGGWVSFWAGAPSWRLWVDLPTKEFLEAVAANQGEWFFSAAAFAVGVLLTLAGLVVLATALRAAGDRVWSELGQAAFLFGAALWLASLAFRATVTAAAANEVAASGIVPEWYGPMRTWPGALFAIYMVLAYLAIAAYGKALLATDVAPRWVSWTHLVFGLAGAVGFITRLGPFGFPLMIHLVPGILGVVLLVRARRARAQSASAPITD